MQVTMNNYWTNIKMYFVYQQLLSLIIIYSMSLHNIKFVPKISLVSVSFWLVLVLFFFGPPYISHVINPQGPNFTSNGKAGQCISGGVKGL